MTNVATFEVEDLITIRTDLQRIADHFGLGEVETYTKSTFGRVNSTFFITIEDDGSEYAVRMLRGANMMILENEYFIQKQLGMAKVRTNEMLLSRDGNYLYSQGDKCATVSKMIHGRHPKPPVSGADCYLMGSALASFHAALEGSVLPHRGVKGFLNYEAIKAKADQLPPGSYADDVIDLLARSGFYKNHDLPVGIIHGDFYFNNILIDEEDIYILDLQDVGEGPLILDIGRCIADVCSYSDELDREKIDSFLKGYESNRRLTSLESQLLDKSIVYGAVATSLSLYMQRGGRSIANQLLRIASAAASF